MLAGMFAAALDAFDTPALSGVWSDITVTHPTTTGSNEDRTVTWSVGGARTVTNNWGSGSLQYRINSGTWTNYTGGFSLASGQTLAWRYNASADIGPSNATVSINGVAIDTFSIQATGFP